MNVKVSEWVVLIDIPTSPQKRKLAEFNPALAGSTTHPDTFTGSSLRNKDISIILFLVICQSRLTRISDYMAA